jgi:hypothetical protein
MVQSLRDEGSSGSSLMVGRCDIDELRGFVQCRSKVIEFLPSM